MQSSRRVGTNEEIATYGTGKTYTSLATWEAATDIDLVTATKSCVLEVYGDSYDDGGAQYAGATTNTSYFRIIRPAAGNKLVSGAITTKHFTYTSTGHTFNVGESNFEVQDIVASVSQNTNADRGCFNVSGNYTNSGFVGCAAIDCVNAYADKVTHGFILNPQTGAGNVFYAKNCLAHNNEGDGFSLNAAAGNASAYNCTSTNNTIMGFNGSDSAQCFIYGCGATGNGTNIDTTQYLTIADCSSSAPTFVDAANDDFHLSSADTVWKNADTNSGSWHASCGYDDDVDSNARVGSWDIGWHEVTVPGYLYVLVFDDCSLQ